MVQYAISLQGWSSHWVCGCWQWQDELVDEAAGVKRPASLIFAPCAVFFCIGMMVRILRQLFSGWWIIVCNTGRLCQTMFEASRDLDWNNKKQWCNGDLQVHVDKLCCDLAFRCHWNDGIWIGKLCTCLYLFHGRTFHVKYCNLFRCEKIIGKWGCIPTSFPKRLFFGDERRNGRSLKFSGSWAKVFAQRKRHFYGDVTQVSGRT